MLQFKNAIRKRSTTSKSQLKKLDEMIKANPSWKGEVSMLEGQEMLQGHDPFTYVTSEGVDKYHYFLYYVGADRRVHYKNIRALYVNGVPLYRNGGNGAYESITDLIIGCLNCSSSTIKALVS